MYLIIILVRKCRSTSLNRTHMKRLFLRIRYKQRNVHTFWSTTRTFYYFIHHRCYLSFPPFFYYYFFVVSCCCCCCRSCCFFHFSFLFFATCFCVYYMSANIFALPFIHSYVFFFLLLTTTNITKLSSNVMERKRCKK